MSALVAQLQLFSGIHCICSRSLPSSVNRASSQMSENVEELPSQGLEYIGVGCSFEPDLCEEKLVCLSTIGKISIGPIEIKCAFCFQFFVLLEIILGSRAIRTRTVDLLGKTDQTYYYQNDLNCFKDPTCIFCALGSFSN
ncbi:hypothetical protein RJ640_006705 [Escallonia rubra]|uniref:Uncharacterized protein n=1 Tax=Escallonia rubra TaxID=112253 RepID=A0AA88UE33_9ASTE|nr:hypothetical protein RJ640_006705 [Escallonia rubra]